MGGNPTQKVDIFGLFTWHTTISIQTRFLPPLIPPSMGETVAQLDYVVKCKCLSTFNWVLSEIIVDFFIVAHIAPQQPDLEWANRAEWDHILDFINWENYTGKVIVTFQEAVLRTQTWWTQNGCQNDILQKLKDLLDPTFQIAAQISQHTHDATGRHTYGHPNQRP